MEDNNDPALYNAAWENPQALVVYDESGAVVSSGSVQQQSASGSGSAASAVGDPPGTIVVIARENGNVTVRTNYDLRYSSGLPFFLGGVASPE